MAGSGSVGRPWKLSPGLRRRWVGAVVSCLDGQRAETTRRGPQHQHRGGGLDILGGLHPQTRCGGEHARKLLATNRARMVSGAAMTRLNSCNWASVAACTAERRAASRTESAWRSPPPCGVSCRVCANVSRAARIASSGSDFAPLQRMARLGLSSSTDLLPPARCRARPAPRPPVPSNAQTASWRVAV